MIFHFLIAAIATRVAFASEEILESLYGIHGKNRITMCINPGITNEQCDGVVWERNWALVNGTCVNSNAMYPVLIFRTDAVLCEKIQSQNVAGARKVNARFLHPSFPEVDFALLYLDQPYDKLDPRRNDSDIMLQKLEPWLTQTFNRYPPKPTSMRYNPYNSSRMMLFSSPVRMVMTAIVMPLTSLIVFFICITFYSGSRKRTVRYKTLHNSRESNCA